jgi:hypothetical protein
MMLAAECFSTGKNITYPVKEGVTMKNKKDNQAQTIIIEMTAWAIILGTAYILVKVIF